MAHMLNKAFPNHIYHITEYKKDIFQLIQFA